MSNCLQHIFDYAEAYAALLVWIVIPVGYLSFYLFFKNHFGMFESTVSASRAETQSESNEHG